MLSILAGFILLAYTAIQNKKQECIDTKQIHINGQVHSINHHENNISVYYIQSGLHKLDVYDKCGINLLKTIEVSSE